MYPVLAIGFLIGIGLMASEMTHAITGIAGKIALVAGALVVGASADPARADGYFNGPQATTSCSSGHACVEGNVRTQGYTYRTTETGWYAISFTNSESTPTIRVRNASTLRSG